MEPARETMLDHRAVPPRQLCRLLGQPFVPDPQPCRNRDDLLATASRSEADA